MSALANRLRALWAFVLLGFASKLSHRAAVYISLAHNLLTIGVKASVWAAIHRANGLEHAGLDLRDMTTYVVLTTVIHGILMYTVYMDVDERLRTGSISIDLVKPFAFAGMVMARGLGHVLFRLFTEGLPTLLIGWALFSLRPPASPTHAAAFCLLVLIALAVSFLIGYTVSLLAFWFLSAWHLDWYLRGFMLVFSGLVIPFWFFPPALGRLAMWLPWRFMVYQPVAMYLGQVEAGEILGTLMAGLAWVTALSLLTGYLWRRAVYRLVVQGG